MESRLGVHFLNGACLFKMVRKALLKNNHASSDGMRSMSFQDTPARSIRNACSLKCFRESDVTVMRGGCLTADPLRMKAMRQ